MKIYCSGGRILMNIPEPLLDSIRAGSAILFLGAGASRGAKNDAGEQPPDGNELKEIICDKFLGGSFKDKGLEFVAELAASETDLFEVQVFIAEMFDKFEPAPFHRILPSFAWRAVVTTNYDRIIEKAYEYEKGRIQEPVVFLSDRQRVDEKLRGAESLLLLKLHGCITSINDEELPLILTVDQYIAHRKNRKRLFMRFEDLAHEYPIIFVGYQMEDSDIRAIFQEINEAGEMRPRYYIVSPGMKKEEINLWNSKRVTVLDCTFEAFLQALENDIPRPFRQLQKIDAGIHPLQSKLENHAMSTSLQNALKYDLDYVFGEMQIEIGTARKFYQGFNMGWYPIEQNLDVRRELTDVFISDIIMLDEQDRPTKVELYLLKAEAGAGKSTFLRRLAWESAVSWNKLCFYLKGTGQIDYNIIHELYRLSQDRLFLFVDNAVDNLSMLDGIITKAKKDEIELTVITCERINEWNMGGDGLDEHVTQEHKLVYLTDIEIKNLIQLLEEHDCLGHLALVGLEKQLDAFKYRAGRQLLVALHEATLGKPFEEILVDEFNEIRSREGQNIYLTVCILNRLGIQLRAGIISRVYGIPFQDFKRRFFAPLEHVVNIVKDKRLGDYAYITRHPQIAQIVFERILNDPHEKFDFYIRLLKELNPTYSTDLTAFRKLILANVLLGLFPNHEEVEQIFSAAFSIMPEDAFVYQQRAIYEMKRPNGSYEVANELLQTAKDLDGKNLSVLHSLAELFLLRSDAIGESLLRMKYRNESKKIARELLDVDRSRKVAYHTLIKGYIGELKDLLVDEESSTRSIDEVVRIIEKHLEDSLQEFPGDSYLHTAESELYDLVGRQSRALDALNLAFKSNPRNAFIAIRLSKTYEKQDNIDLASTIIKDALEVNPGDQKLHYRLAMLLLRDSNSTNDEKLYHLRRSFTRGDRQFEAQFWYALHLYLTGLPEDIQEAKTLFRNLRDSRVAFETKTSIRHYIRDQNGDKKLFQGTITRLESSFGFVCRDGHADTIFMHKDNIKKELWKSLKAGSRIEFCVGFNFGGPCVLMPESDID